MAAAARRASSASQPTTRATPSDGFFHDILLQETGPPRQTTAKRPPPPDSSAMSSGNAADITALESPETYFARVHCIGLPPANSNIAKDENRRVDGWQPYLAERSAFADVDPDDRERMIRAEEVQEAARDKEVADIVRLATQLGTGIQALVSPRRSPPEPKARPVLTPTPTTHSPTPAAHDIDASTAQHLERALRRGDIREYHRRVAMAARQGRSGGATARCFSTTPQIDPQTTVAMLRKHPHHFELYTKLVRSMEVGRRSATPGAATSRMPSPDVSDAPPEVKDHVHSNVAAVPHLTRAAVLRTRREGFAETCERIRSARARKYSQEREAQQQLDRKVVLATARINKWFRQKQREQHEQKDAVVLSRLERRWWALVHVVRYTQKGFMAMCEHIREQRVDERQHAAARVIQLKLYRGVMMRLKLANAMRMLVCVRRAGGAQMIRNWRRRMRIAMTPMLRVVLSHLARDRSLLFRAACRRYFERIRTVQNFLRMLCRQRRFQLAVYRYQWMDLETDLLEEARCEGIRTVRNVFRRASRGMERIGEEHAQGKLQRLSRPSLTISERLERTGEERRRSDAAVTAIAEQLAEKESRKTCTRCPEHFIAQKLSGILDQKRRHFLRVAAEWEAKRRQHQQRMEDYDFHLFIAQGTGKDLPVKPPPLPPAPIFWLRLNPSELEPVIKRGWRVAERERTFMQILSNRQQLNRDDDSTYANTLSDLDIFSRAVATARAMRGVGIDVTQAVEATAPAVVSAVVDKKLGARGQGGRKRSAKPPLHMPRRSRVASRISGRMSRVSSQRSMRLGTRPASPLTPGTGFTSTPLGPADGSQFLHSEPRSPTTPASPATDSGSATAGGVNVFTAVIPPAPPKRASLNPKRPRSARVSRAS